MPKTQSTTPQASSTPDHPSGGGIHPDSAHLDGAQTDHGGQLVQERAEVNSSSDPYILIQDLLKSLAHSSATASANASTTASASSGRAILATTPFTAPPFPFDQVPDTFRVPPFPFLQSTAATTTVLDQFLQRHFPLVSRETLQEIIHFEFFPPDLYKLNPMYLEKGLDLETKTEDYPTFDSLMEPLVVYFQILSCYAASSNSISALLAIHRGSHVYRAHLSSLNRTYKWPAVLEYHSQFFFRRSREMARGDFSGWCSPDNELISQVLLGHDHPQPGSPSSFFPILFILFQFSFILYHIRKGEW